MDASSKAGTNAAAIPERKPPKEPKPESQVRDATEHRYQRLFQTAHDGILLLDAGTGRIIDANPFMTFLLGLSHDEFLGKQLWEVGLLRDADRRRGVLDDVAHLGVVRWEELLVQSMVHPNGMDVEVVSSSYREGDHQVIQCHVRDITEQKRAALTATRRSEGLVAADRHKDEFMAMVSHELRNAIAPVVNALVILRLEHEVNSPVSNRAQDLIERQVVHLTRIVSDLQEISSVDQAPLGVRSGVIDLRTTVQRSVEAVISSHAHRSPVVTVNLPPDPVWLDADTIRMQQVVVNLLSNAANYTPVGGRITVTLSMAGERTELRVADTGIGIPAEMLTQVFDLFTRVESGRTFSRDGLGIGLNIVKRIVDQYGGSVVASSAGVGAGSEFVVSLPLAPSPS